MAMFHTYVTHYQRVDWLRNHETPNLGCSMNVTQLTILLIICYVEMDPFQDTLVKIISSNRIKKQSHQNVLYIVFIAKQKHQLTKLDCFKLQPSCLIDLNPNPNNRLGLPTVIGSLVYVIHEPFVHPI